MIARNEARELRGSEADQVNHRGGHAWMMVVCCIPMLVIAGALMASGVISAGFLFYAVGCTAMMVMMMRMMSGGTKRGS